MKEVLSIEEVCAKGVTEPLLCILENEEEAIVKYQYNRFGTIVLVREWIGGMIARLINIPIPEFGECFLSEQVIETSYRLGCTDGEIDGRNAGLAFFSLYANAKPFPYDDNKLKIKKEWGKIVLYDYILNNCDRHNGNILMSIDDNDVLCIDNSHIITNKLNDINEISVGLSEECILSMSFFDENRQLYDILLKKCDKQDLLEYANEIKYTLTNKELDIIKKSIPDSWRYSITDDYLDGLFAIVQKRIQCLDMICEKIEEVRNDE